MSMSFHNTSGLLFLSLSFLPPTLPPSGTEVLQSEGCSPELTCLETQQEGEPSERHSKY